VPNCDLAGQLVGFAATRSLDEIIRAVIGDQQARLSLTAGAAP
jgi:hypothetical protein